jgi:pimeloyl-ACP methyl ester carboxylesterase
MRFSPSPDSPSKPPVKSSESTSPRVHAHDRWIEHPHGRIHARRWSPEQATDLAPIVMLHDSLGSVALWRTLPAELSRATAREVVAYDRLGFGKSDPRVGRPGRGFVGEEATDVLPVLREQLRIGKFVAFGHSVGGGMAIHAAAAWPADCVALVTIAAQVFAEERTLEGIRAAQVLFEDPAQVERLAKYHGDKARWVLDAWIGTWLDPAFAQWSLADVLARVTCPVLAIHGEVDEYGSTRHAETIVRLVGGSARVELLPGGGHMPHREEPARVVALVAQFLADQA